jgi:DNA polymerase/3'-5' exonuclease PolX
LAYTKASSALKKHPKKITSGEEASKVRGVGKSIAEKIDEFIKYGHMKKLEALTNDELIRTLQLFGAIWGVGPSTAKTWYSQGFRTLEDIKTKAKLNAQQAIGLKYYEDFKQRFNKTRVLTHL